MALNWDWNKKVGKATIFCNDKEVEYSLYQGNAFLIIIYEYEEDGRQMYSMNNFIVDKEHAKNCFGLSKDYKDNIFDTEYYKIKKIEINDDNYSYTKDLIGYLLKAFNDIEIKITKGEN